MNQPNEATVNADTPITRKPLRLWPGVLIVIVQWLLRFVVPLIAPEATLFGVPLVFIGVLGGVLCGLLIILWWLFFSRAPWSERLGAIALMIVALIATSRVVDKSIAGGAMGMLLYVLAIPLLSLGLVLWAVASRHLSLWPRRAALVVTILISSGIFTLIRTGGFTADFDNDFHWRWTKTPEQQLLAQTAGQPATLTPISAATSAATKTNSDWPGFRGPERDGVVRGVRIKTDWTASPPVELWRQPIGPGWSSFAVHNDLIYTQEQRGDDEAVACYSLITGKPVWRHTDAARFYESNAGAGPRGTPSLSNGRVYTLGATGIVNALDASTPAPRLAVGGGHRLSGGDRVRVHEGSRDDRRRRGGVSLRSTDSRGRRSIGGSRLGVGAGVLVGVAERRVVVGGRRGWAVGRVGFAALGARMVLVVALVVVSFVFI